MKYPGLCAKAGPAAQVMLANATAAARPGRKRMGVCCTLEPRTETKSEELRLVVLPLHDGNG
jgi:hypothetical protein